MDKKPVGDKKKTNKLFESIRQCGNVEKRKLFMNSVVNKRQSEITITLFCQRSWEKCTRNLTDALLTLHFTGRRIPANNVIYCLYSICISLHQEFPPNYMALGILQS